MRTNVTVLNLLVAVLLAGCQSPEAVPQGAASREGGLYMSVADVKRTPMADVKVGAYANYAAAVVLHSRSDRLLNDSQGGPLGVNPPAMDERRKMLAESGDCWREAVTLYQKALAADPKSVAACEGLARGWLDRGDAAEGIKWLKRAVDIDGQDFSLLYEFARQYEETGAGDKAVDIYQRAMDAREDDTKRKLVPLVLLRLGNLYEKQNKYQDAVNVYKRFIALKAEPDDIYDDNEPLISLMKNRAPVYRKLGEMLLKLGKNPEAAEAFRQAAQLEPARSGNTLRLAALYRDAANYPKALEFCRQYLESSPNSVEGLELLMDIHRRMGRIDLAEAAAKDALKKDPERYEVHALLGDLYRRLARTDAALAEYRKVIDARKPYLAAYTAAVEIELTRKRLGVVLAVLARAIDSGLTDETMYDQLDKTLADAAAVKGIVKQFEDAYNDRGRQFGYFYVLGRLQQALKDSDEAIAAFRDVIRLKPDFVHCYIRLATVYVAVDKPEEAAKVLKQAALLQPENPLIWRFLADVQTASNDIPGAIDSMRRAIYLQPDNPLNIAFLVELMDKAGRTDEALDFLQRGMRNNPENIQTWAWLLGTFYTENLRRYDDAIKVLDGALAEKPNNATLLSSLGYAYFRKRDYAQAAETYRKVVALSPEHLGSRTYLALSLENDGKPADAEAVLRDALKQEPKSAPMMGELGRFLVRTKRNVEEGLRLLKQAVEMDPENPGALLSLGSAYQRLDRNDEAIKTYEKLLAMDPAGTEARYQLAMIYDKTDRFDKAEKLLQEVLARDPDDGVAANALGYLYAERNMKLDDAEKLVELALKQEPENGAYLDSMGWVFYRKGEMDKALAYLRKAAELEPDSVIVEHLGDVYAKLGNNELALTHYEQALKLDPEDKTAPKKIEAIKAGKDPLLGDK